MTSDKIDIKYKNLSQRDHIRLRMSSYIGSQNETNNKIWILNKDDNSLNKEELNYSIALYNAIDEVIQNAIDHCHRTKSIKGLNKCNEIKLTFNNKTGEISVFNNGQGIEVKKFNNSNDYIAEVIFSKYLSGSNFEDDKTISIGQNGLGVKVTNTISEYFIIETTDMVNKLNYEQKFENGNLNKSIPIISKLTKLDKDKKKPYTKIIFKPEYKLFNDNGFTTDLSKILDKLLYTRMNYVSIYLGKSYKIYYNNELMTKNDISDLSKLLVDESDIIKTKLLDSNKNSYDVNLLVYDCHDNQEQISFVNGMNMIDGGTHIKFINKLILENLKSKLEKKLNDKVKITNKLISNYLFIIFNGDIINPSYKSQSKTELNISESRFKYFQFPPIVYKQLWNKLEHEFDKIYLNKISKEIVTKKVNKLKGIEMFEDAINAGTKNGFKCSLFVTEGLSATSCIDRGLCSNKKLGYSYYGTYSIKGVPLNALKEIDVKVIKKGNKIEYIIDKKKKLLENERINSLIKVLNLNYSYNYDKTNEGDKEFLTLRYGSIILSTDADSVTGDTPLTLMDNNNNIIIKNIEDLTSNYTKNLINNKEYGTTDFKIWSDNGWTNIKYVMRHKISKDIYRILTHTGCVDVTKDHSLLDENSIEITPNNCNLDTKLLHKQLQFLENIIDLPNEIEKLNRNELNIIASKLNIQYYCKLKKNILIKKIIEYKKFNDKNKIILNKKSKLFDHSEAYILGLFFGDGSCNIYKRINENRNNTITYNWAIVNTNINILQNSKNILENIYGYYFKILTCVSNNKKYYKLILNGGKKTKYIIDKYKNLLYYDKSKYIHPEILNSNYEIRKNFFDGFYDADGRHNLEITKRTDIFTKITTHCIFVLATSLNYKVSINHEYNSNKKNVYSLCYTQFKQSKIKNKIKKIWKLEKTNNEYYVYDLETENHHFQAGIGNLIVHNTDGFNICGLILSYFQVFFPNLFKRNYIKVFLTPQVRAHPKNKKKYIEEFYSESEYENWIKKNNINEYNIKYIKGLAGHSKMEVANMFSNLDKNIFKFDLDKNAKDYFEIYYGQDPDKRKEILSNESIYKDDEYEIKYKNKIIPCSYHLNINTKEYQLDNIERKMPHLVDGLNPSKRKILAGSIKKFKNNNHEIKVFQLGGYVAEHMLYHHGGDSLNKTIIGMAADYPGAKNIPLLLPIGDFGSRKFGLESAGAPRYIETKLNTAITNLLFPNDDNDLLKYNIVDGILAEPKYYIPILPMILLEDILLPATGWKIEMYARDLHQIIKNVKSLINNSDIKLKEMDYFKNKFKVKEIKKFNLLVGTYKIENENIIIVTELPPRVWTKSYQDSLEKKEYIEEVLINECSDENIHIVVKLKPGKLEELKNKYKIINDLDYIEYYLNLYTKMSHCINVYMPNKTVKSYTNYNDILYDWYKIRKNCYIKRIQRILILLKYKIMMYENIIKFIENHEKYNLSKLSDDKIDDILINEKYKKFNKSILETPGLIKNEELENSINYNSSYDYLLNLSYRKMNNISYENYKNKLKIFNDQYKYYNTKNVYINIWNNEIDELYKELKNGLKNGFYTETDKKFKN